MFNRDLALAPQFRPFDERLQRIEIDDEYPFAGVFRGDGNVACECAFAGSALLRDECDCAHVRRSVLEVWC